MSAEIKRLSTFAESTYNPSSDGDLFECGCASAHECLRNRLCKGAHFRLGRLACAKNNQLLSPPHHAYLAYYVVWPHCIKGVSLKTIIIPFKEKCMRPRHARTREHAMNPPQCTKAHTYTHAHARTHTCARTTHTYTHTTLATSGALCH